MLGDRVHFHRVGRHNAVKAHIAAQNVGDDGLAERGRQVDGVACQLGHIGFGLDLRIDDMRRHDHLGAGADAGLERDQLVLL